MIGIIGAMAVEVDGFEAIMTDKSYKTVSGIKYTVGKLWGKETVVAVSGIGKVNAAICTQTMIMLYSPDFIINSGVAGGLDQSLNVLDAVVAEYVVQHDMDTSAVGDPVGFISGLDMIKIPCDKKICKLLKDSAEESDIHVLTGTIASGDQFVCSNERRKYIIETFNAYACEMESAAIGHVCFKNNTPFCAIRSISDNADDNSHLSYTEFVNAAAGNLMNVMKNFYSRI